MYNYRITAMRHGSDRYGPCEVCGKHCATTYYQVETKDYRIDEVMRQVGLKFGVTFSGDIGQTHHNCVDRFGHEECLISTRR